MTDDDVCKNCSFMSREWLAPNCFTSTSLNACYSDCVWAPNGFSSRYKTPIGNFHYFHLNLFFFIFNSLVSMFQHWKLPLMFSGGINCHFKIGRNQVKQKAMTCLCWKSWHEITEFSAIYVRK